MRVFVTGGGGFIGACVVEELLKHGHEVALLLRPGGDRWRIRAALDRVSVVEGNLDALEAVAADVADFGPDAVVHLAWRGVAGADRNRPEQLDNITRGRDLAALARRSGARAFVGVGSQAEYGPKNRRIDETAAPEPTTLYGVAKLATCRALEIMTAEDEMRFAWLRVFSTYGPRDDPRWLIPSMILKLLRREPVPLTKGEQRWDFLHVRDAARAIVAVATGEASGVFNLGSGEAPPLRQTIEALRDLVDPALPLGFGDVPYRPDQVMHLEADVGRLRREVHWSPSISLAEGLERTVEWFRCNPQ